LTIFLSSSVVVVVVVVVVMVIVILVIGFVVELFLQVISSNQLVACSLAEVVTSNVGPH
jgi:hypothetical protein